MSCLRPLQGEAVRRRVAAGGDRLGPVSMSVAAVAAAAARALGCQRAYIG